MGFKEDLDGIRLQVATEVGPDVNALLDDYIREIKESGIEAKAIRIGDEIPAFTLPNARGELVNSTDLLLHGPLVVSFYRGAWCPFCNFYLKTLREWIPVFRQYDAQLVAISGMTPDDSLSFKEKLDLDFEVLSDKGLKVAESFGLVYDLNDLMLEFFRVSGVDYVKMYDSDKFRLPIPATYVTDHRGIVIAEIDADWRNRLDPLLIESALQKIA